ncbi:MAG: hypothetical protein ABUK08_03320 [Candidatus Humimicrobiaceae bacterium]
MNKIAEKIESKVSNRFSFAIKVIFLLWVAFFMVTMVFFFVPIKYISTDFLFTAIPGIIFLLLGIALIVLIAKSGLRGLSKKFLLITVTAPIGAVVSVALHNFVYGVFIYFFGADFWERTGMGEEPVFFFIAIFICPVAFLVGVVGSIVLLIKGRRTA